MEKGILNYLSKNGTKKQPGIVILIPNKTDFKQKLVKRHNQKHFLLSKKKKKKPATGYQYIFYQTGKPKRNKCNSTYICPTKLNQDKMNNLN